jgi:hypothetical protein
MRVGGALVADLRVRNKRIRADDDGNHDYVDQ